MPFLTPFIGEGPHRLQNKGTLILSSLLDLVVSVFLFVLDLLSVSVFASLCQPVFVSVGVGQSRLVWVSVLVLRLCCGLCRCL